MDPALLVRGLVIGFAVAAALGPVGLLVIRRTVDRGWSYGFASGLGVATADAAYGAIAALGLSAVSEVLVGIDQPLGIVGGAFLLVLAARALLAARTTTPEPLVVTPGERRRRDGRVAAFASMVALTLTNPATILSFAALFASIGAGAGGAAGAAVVTAGVFLGSAAWWLVLTALMAGLRTRLTPRAVRILNVGSALVIAAFGITAIGVGIAAG